MVINAQAFNPTIWLNQLYILASILLLQFNSQTLVYTLLTIQSLCSRDEIHLVFPVQLQGWGGGGEGGSGSER